MNRIYIYLPVVGILLSGGYWVESEWLYNLHPAATLGICILTFLMMPYTIQKSHDSVLYKMYITISRENEYRFKALLAKLDIKDPVDDD